MKIPFETIKDLKIVVVGDSMLDVFSYGTVERMSPEAPVPILKHNKEHFMLGGALNVVANLHSLGAKVTIFSILGDDTNGRKILSLLEKMDDLEAYITIDKNAITTTKTRFLSGNQHLLRHDSEEKTILNSDTELQIIKNLIESCNDADVIIASDYAKGFMTPKIRLALAQLKCKAYKIVDTKGNVSDYANGFDLITPNVKELSNLSKTMITSPTNFNKAIENFTKEYNFPNILITASEHGMQLYQKLSKSYRVISEIAYNTNPVDVSGAGDTVVASLAIAIGLKVNLQDALEFASRCAGISIGKSGTSTVTLDEILSCYNKTINYKEIDTKKLIEQKELGRTIGFVNGCFDTLHAGHLSLLKQAKEKCQFLIVAINSDKTIKDLKGTNRPINDEHTRAELLASLKYVDMVVIFDEKDPRKLIQKLLPDIAFKGREYENKKIIEQKLLDSIECPIVYFDTCDVSTTKIIEKMRKEA